MFPRVHCCNGPPSDLQLTARQAQASPLVGVLAERLGAAGYTQYGGATLHNESIPSWQRAAEGTHHPCAGEGCKSLPCDPRAPG